MNGDLTTRGQMSTTQLVLISLPRTTTGRTRLTQTIRPITGPGESNFIGLRKVHNPPSFFSMMDENEEVREDLRRKIMFGINRTAILYNAQRLTDPEKYDFRYQWDHLWFQVRRTGEPGFFRHIFMLSHKSPNFQSNRSFVMKIILRDLCAGRFNTDQLSGVADLESFHKKNKIGDYEPRHARRRLNEELKDLVVEKGRVDPDERKISYGSAFSIDPTKLDPILDEANKMWEEEIRQRPRDLQNGISQFRAISLKEIYHERWSDLIVLQKRMLDTLGTFDDEIKSGAYFSALHYEVSSFSRYFIILSNHINSICEIFWFMKKAEDKRASLLHSRPVLKVDKNDIDKTLSIMYSIGWNSQDIVIHLISVPAALMSFGFNSLALELSNDIMVLGRNTEMEAATGLEFISMLRNQGKYKEMLEISMSTIENYSLGKDQLLFGLLKIRNAEALALNGKHNLAVNELEEIFSIRDRFRGSYVPYVDWINQTSDYVLTEKEPLPDAGSIPVRVSILENLITAALRISEYCRAKKYLEELFDTESNYFKREDALDSFLNLNRVYNEMIFRCKSKQ